MRRLTRYLSRLFVTDALILFGVVCFLLWLVNCLRSFDVVSVKGQGIFTLASQALLTMPPLAVSFFYICIGIGLVRALLALQASHELHIIHTSYGLGSLFRATAVVTGAGVLGVLLLSNVIEPYANRSLNDLSAEVAADLVSSTLKPKRFTQVTPGVVLHIGGRSPNGEIREFFADDRRDPETRRTYIAESARVSSDGDNYVIELHNGSLQYTRKNGRFSEITFGRYDLGVEGLAQAVGTSSDLTTQDSFTIVSNAWQSDNWSPYVVSTLNNRMAEGLRVIGICMLVLAMAGFPSGRRARIQIPMEAVVMLIAFAERGLSAYSPLGPATGAFVMVGVGFVALLVRTVPRRVMVAA